MKKTIIFTVLSLLVFILISCNSKNPTAIEDEGTPSPVFTQVPVLNLTAVTTQPSSTVRLMWIHHSTGSAWVRSSEGNLGTNLNTNDYYVTEADYGWTITSVPASCHLDIGNYTDTSDWPCWFNDTTMPSVYSNSSHYDYTNTITDPGGENNVIMFKSCYPNSEVGTSIADEQIMYNGLLTYFGAHTDKLFILVIPPPEINISSAALTRQLSNWLVDRQNGWLSSYAHDNVYAFDYYNVLTHPDNHHRIVNGQEVHQVYNAQNSLYYYTGSDSHPTAVGHQKATAEFLPLLNSWYNEWIN